jgi:hypothetical protein
VAEDEPEEPEEPALPEEPEDPVLSVLPVLLEPPALPEPDAPVPVPDGATMLVDAAELVEGW